MDGRRVTERGLWDLREDLRAGPIRLVAAGKAALGMAAAAVAAFGPRIVDAIVAAPAGAPRHDDVEIEPRWIVTAGHPIPNHASETAGRRALAIAADNAAAQGTLVVCLSGGASALMAAPADGLTVADKQETTRLLLAAGATVAELNVVRRQMSAIKGGRLAARGGRTVTLAISDVCVPEDDDPAVIGSGPTVGGSDNAADALAVLRRFGVDAAAPASVLAHLRRPAAANATDSAIAADDPRLRAASYWVIASRHDAMRAAGATATRLGYRVEIRRAAVTGPAADAGRALVAAAVGALRPSCVISSGETTVAVRGTGRGGRNQELAVAALEGLASLAPADFASIGTDGVDGVTDAAGAFIDSSMWGSLGANAPAICRDALERNDSGPLLDRLDAAVTTGPTGTNVGDLQVLLLA